MPSTASSPERAAADCSWDWSVHSSFTVVTSCGGKRRRINWIIIPYLEESAIGDVTTEEAPTKATVVPKQRTMPFPHKPIRPFWHSCRLFYFHLSICSLKDVTNLSQKRHVSIHPIDQDDRKVTVSTRETSFVSFFGTLKSDGDGQGTASLWNWFIIMLRMETTSSKCVYLRIKLINEINTISIIIRFVSFDHHFQYIRIS